MPLSLPSASISSSEHVSSKAKSILVWFLIILTLPFVSGTEVVSAQAQRRRGVRPGGVVKRPATTTAPDSDIDDATPLDPLIVSESQKLQQRSLEEQQRVERELLAKNDPAQTALDDLWGGYRQTFPFHSQVIALSEAAVDGSRTLVISEPPPHVSLGDILITIGSDLLLNHQVKKHEIGYDGWVKDIVIAIKANDEQLQAMLSRLNQRLFFTSYKSYTLRLPSRIRGRSLDLNLSITPAELNQWIVVDGEQFFPVEGGPAETLTSLGKEQSSRVYVSRRRGLIGWWIPKKRNLYECRVPARQFSLDADLIVGAIANQSGVFVLGRERTVPVDILPPLRFETLALLADVQAGQNGSLAQSYERGHPYAGRIAEGKDWAPILLSPELRDAEYGSLLNITDQLLKGWSNGGETRYENFPYPVPGRYPFPKPLWEHLKIGAGQALTYNWNTKGVGFTVNFGPVTYLTLNRSGALPVSYIPEGTGETERTVVAAEDTGYDYFSGLGDPNLARVVQYAAAYQIFSAFDVARSPKQVPGDNYPDQLLESLTTELNNTLRQASDVELDNIAQQLTASILSSLEDRIHTITTTQIEDFKKQLHEELRRKGYEPGSKEYAEKFDYVLNEAKKEQRRRIETGLGSEIREQLTLTKLNLPAKDTRGDQVRKSALSQFAYLRQMPQRYAQAIDRRARGWIHTPVVVISGNTNRAFIGGHNLDARVSKIKVDESSLPGQVRIDRTGTLIVNPRDLARVGGLARNVERNDLFRELSVAVENGDQVKFASVQTKIEAALTNAPVTMARPRETALQLPPPPNKPPINKPPISNGEPGGAGGAGWGGDGRSSIPLAVEGKRRDSSIIRIEARDNRFDVEYSIANSDHVYALKGLTHEDAVDVAARQAAQRVQPGKTVVVEFEGLSEQRAGFTLDSIQIQMGHQGQPNELLGRLISGERQPATEVLASKYDFNRAKVEVAEIDTLSTGEFQQEVSLAVPAFENASQPVIFKAELKFSRWTPRNVVSAVAARVSTAFTGMAKRWSRLAAKVRFDSNVEAYNKDLARSLKKIKLRTKLDFHVKTKVDLNFSDGGPQRQRDIYIGKRKLSNEEPESRTGTHQSE